ncbi:chloride channel protein 2 [Trichinella spiralis]|uniref:chloride channel protein 2 n=1 Tax=Trichinella spiralis TaxID=6334 RepID=UPI0001EFDD58|nr:chloride channel protein 2 [Trichinella spiralis]
MHVYWVRLFNTFCWTTILQCINPFLFQLCYNPILSLPSSYISTSTQSEAVETTQQLWNKWPLELFAANLNTKRICPSESLFQPKQRLPICAHETFLTSNLLHLH